MVICISLNVRHLALCAGNSAEYTKRLAAKTQNFKYCTNLVGISDIHIGTGTNLQMYGKFTS